MKNKNFQPPRVLFLAILGLFFFASSGWAQQVKGKITDSKNGVLPGVTVMVKGSTDIGTITDMDGKYVLNVPDAQNAILQVTFIGMENQEIPVQGRAVIDIVMQDEFTQLDEVVAIGYGTVKKRDITGAVASVGGDDLKQIPVASAAEAMTGRLAGVQISSTEGSPDAEMTIRVRGGGSITQDNSPLIIVDGFPVNSINDVSPADIENIDVLKDASSTAIYGSRGANGVVIITTKQGKAGGVQVNINSFAGVKRIANTLDVMDPYEYTQWQYEYAWLRNNEPDGYYNDYFGNYQDIDLYKNAPANDWQKQIYGRTGTVFSNDISIRGGSESTKYSLSYSRFDDKAIMIGSGYVRDNLSLKLNHKVNDKIDLSFSMRYANTRIDGGGANEVNEKSTGDSRLKHAVTYSPIPFDGVDVAGDDPDGSVSSFVINPITATWDNYRQQKKENLNFAGSFSWKMLKGVTFKDDIGYEVYDYNDQRFYGTTTYNARTNGGSMPIVILTNRDRVTMRNAATFNFDLKEYISNEDHSASVLIGNEIIHAEQTTLTDDIRYLPVEFGYEDAFRLTSQGTPNSSNNYISPDDNLVSFFGRANYDYKSKYIISATFRADGSSKFAKENQWGFFPSAAAAWRISAEPFMQGASGWLDDLKLRASYGTAGNNNIPSGVMTSFYSSKNTERLDGVSSIWTQGSTMANPDLKWETTYTRNIGLDFALLNSRLNGNVEAYQNTTEDLLIAFPVAGTGYDIQYRNIGSTENRGIEVTLNWAAIRKADFDLNFGFNIGFNKNEVTSLGGVNYLVGASEWTSDITQDFRIVEGKSVGQMYGYKTDGIYTVEDFSGYDEGSNAWILKDGPDPSGITGKARPGMMKLKDLNGDDKIDAEDMDFIGDANPLATGGFNINARYKGFDLSAVFNYSIGGDVYNANKIEYSMATQRYPYRNLLSDMEGGKRWTYIDRTTGEFVTDLNKLKEMNEGATEFSPYADRHYFSDWAVEDGSFIRLSTLTFGYTLPKSILDKVNISNVRVYATAYNVFCLTNYSGFDPEVSTRRKSPLTPSVDYSAYPRSRQVVFGLNLSF
nr:TonB-dependent receptor [uncultured Carboxylicivirga sp.]